MLIIFCLGLLVVIYYVSIQQQSKNGISKINLIQSANSVTPTVTVTPTMVPVVLDKNSNLEEEVDKLIPEDFSQDFNKLKEEVNSF